jgi:hypothetical protein
VVPNEEDLLKTSAPGRHLRNFGARGTPALRSQQQPDPRPAGGNLFGNSLGNPLANFPRGKPPSGGQHGNPPAGYPPGSETGQKLAKQPGHLSAAPPQKGGKNAPPRG